MTLQQEVDRAVDLASDLGDRWTGTTLGRVLDNERANVLSLMRVDEPELASVAVINLLNTCKYAEKLEEEL